jgi:hypothetical protein
LKAPWAVPIAIARLIILTVIYFSGIWKSKEQKAYELSLKETK